MITKKDLSRTLRLLDLYKIDKIHKEFLSNIKARSIIDWYDIANQLIDRYSSNTIKAEIARYKSLTKKNSNIQYIW